MQCSPAMQGELGLHVLPLLLDFFVQPLCIGWIQTQLIWHVQSPAGPPRPLCGASLCSHLSTSMTVPTISLHGIGSPQSKPGSIDEALQSSAGKVTWGASAGTAFPPAE